MSVITESMKPPKTTLVLIHDKTGKLESKQKSKTFMKENKNFVTRTTFQKKKSSDNFYFAVSYWYINHEYDSVEPV